MIEILTMGNCRKEFKRLGISPKLTYNGANYKVYEMTEKEFRTLCDEPDIEGTWTDCGWRHSDGSNQGEPNDTIKVRGKELKCWYEPDIEEDYEEPGDTYDNLLEYLSYEKGCSSPKNVCALGMDLAKHNGMTLSELFRIYQG